MFAPNCVQKIFIYSTKIFGDFTKFNMVAVRHFVYVGTSRATTHKGPFMVAPYHVKCRHDRHSNVEVITVWVVVIHALKVLFMAQFVGLMTFVRSTCSIHPSLVMHPQVLFKLILFRGYVHTSFGIGVTILWLLNDKTGNVNDVDDYCKLILSPDIWKLKWYWKSVGCIKNRLFTIWLQRKDWFCGCDIYVEIYCGGFYKQR